MSALIYVHEQFVFYPQVQVPIILRKTSAKSNKLEFFTNVSANDFNAKKKININIT
jgi:hypothetical protein